jgi:hypothetical protein
LLIDFEKAFDSISWNFLNNIFKFFNFGESIQKWVQKCFFNDSSDPSKITDVSSAN